MGAGLTPFGRWSARRAGTSALVALVALSSTTALVASTATRASAATSPTSPTSPTSIVIDTDTYSNTDDEGALAVAFGLQLQGQANVLAIGVDTRTSRPAVATNSWKCVAAITQFYGFPDVPIGSDLPDNGTTVNSPDVVGPCGALASASTPPPTSAVSLYRKTLAAQPDASVVMVGVGYEENLANLLASGPDASSPLSGRDLVAQKVKELVVMGGGYPSRSGENNFIGNPAAAESVAANWPTKVVYSGYEVGYGVFTGHTLSSVHPANSPVRVAYEALVGAGKNNRSYDVTALYHALRPGDALLSEVGPGQNAIDATGANVFTAGAGNDYYLTVSNTTTLQNTLEGLMDVLPGTTPQAVTFTSSAPVNPPVGTTYAPTAVGGASGNAVTFSIDPSSTSGCTYDVASGLVSFAGPAGTCVIDADQGPTTVYAPAARVAQSVSVTPLAQSVGFTSSPPGSAKVGDTYAVAAVATSGLAAAITVDASSTAGCTYSAATRLVSFGAPAGTCVIDADQAGNSSYAPAATAQQSINVVIVAQTINFSTTPPTNPRVGSTYAVGASSDSGLPVAISIDATSTSGCTYSAATGLVTFGPPAGTCVIDADQPGNATYSPAAQVQQVVASSITSQSVAFSTTPPANTVVGGTYGVAATATSGLPVVITVDATSTSGCAYSAGTGVVTFAGPAGTCVLDADQAGDAFYAPAPEVQQVLSVSVAPQAVTFLTTPPPNPLVGTSYAVVATGGASGNPVTFSIDASSTSGCTYVAATGAVKFLAPAGTCVIDADQAGNASYAPALTARQGFAVALPPPPTPVIVDTDIYSNTDDEGALAVAFGLQLQGQANVLAIGVDTRTSRPAVATNSWKCVAAITQFYGFPDVPIGSDLPDNGTTVNSPDVVGPCGALASASTPPPTSAVSLYRKTLAAQPDASVVMVGVGYEENLANLLASGPDASSPLSGRDLVAQKVKELVVMGGGYPSRSGENNFIGNPAAAESVAANWPTKVVYSGYEVGYGVFTGHTLSSVHPANSPVRVAYEALVGAGKNNRSYDVTALYHALRPGDALLSEVGPGQNAIDATGANVFTAGAGNDYYLTVSNTTTLQNTLEGLMDVLPGTTPQAVTFTSSAPVNPPVGTTYAPTAVGGASGNAVTFSIDPSSTSGCTYDVASGLVSFAGPAGTCVIDADQGPTTVYAPAARVAQSVSVTPLAQSVGFTSSPPGSAKVGDTYAVAAVATSGLAAAITVDASSTAGCTYSAATRLVSFAAPAGTCVIDADQAGNGTYLAAQRASQSIAVAKGTQTITFTSTPPGAPRVGRSYPVTATSSAGLAVTLSIDAVSAGDCSVSGATFTVLRSGPCVLDANQPGSAGYLPAAQVQQTEVKGTQTVRFTTTPPSGAKVLGTYAVAATSSAGLAVAITIDRASSAGCAYSAATGVVTFTGPAGTCVLDANQAGNAVFSPATQVQQSVTVAKATQVVAFTSTAPSPAKVGATYGVAAAATSGLAVTITVDRAAGGICSISAGTVTFLKPGTCVLDANQAGNSSWAAATQVRQSFAITA